MMDTRNYNIHNILTVKINHPKRYLDEINLKFGYFERNQLETPDIELNIRNFDPDVKDCTVVDHKYYVKENYLFCKEKEGTCAWKVEFIGFNDGKITINYFGRNLRGSNYINPDFLAQNFLLKVMEYQLLRKGYFLAHAGGVSKGGKAVIFPGRGGTFKTSICMDLVRKSNYDFLGDDRVLVGEDLAYCFPMGYRVFRYMLESLKDENSWDLMHKIKLLKTILVKDSGYSQKVCEPADKYDLFFVTRSTDQSFKVETYDNESTIKKLYCNNRIEDYIDISSLKIRTAPFARYMLAYSYVHPDSEVSNYANNYSSLLSKIIGDRRSSGIFIPRRYDESVYKKVRDLIQT